MNEQHPHNQPDRSAPALGATDRRSLERSPSRATALIFRDTDAMRTGVAAAVHDLSSAGVGLVTTTPLETGEQIRLRLENLIQRIQRDVRGVVRHVTEQPHGRFRIGVELYTRLSPLDLCLLKSPLAAAGGDDSPGPAWI